MPRELLSHQVAALDALERDRRVLLGFAPGTGKSLIAIEAMERYGSGSTPFLTMASGGLPVFAQQADEWGFGGSPLTVPYGMLSKWAGTPDGQGRARKGVPVAVADECHRLKNRKTGWTKTFEKLTAKDDRLLLMTGTPMPKTSIDLFMFLRLLFPGDRRFTSYWRWIGNWYEMEMNRHTGMMSTVGRFRRDVDEFVAQFEGRWLLADNAKDLPPLRYQWVECSMTKAQDKAYRELKRELATTVGEEEIVYFQPGTQWAKMIQITTGLQTVNPLVESSGKLEVLDSILSDREGQSTIVFCLYRGTAEAVLKMYPEAEAIHGGKSKPQRAESARRFQAGEVPILVCTYPAAAEGWNLQRADCVVRLESAVRAGDMVQAAKRAHRMGQTKPVLVIDLVCPGTVDSKLRGRLESELDQTREVEARLTLL